MSADAGIFFQGWMHKKNDNTFIGDKWNKRWFVLYEDGILAYYANQVLEDKKNSLKLKGSKLNVLPKEHINKKRPWCFELATTERTFLLSCLNEKDFRSWIYWLSKGHPDAPIERSGTFYNTVIDEVLQNAEVQNRRQSLTRRVTEAAQNFFRGREKAHSAVDVKLSDHKSNRNYELDHDSTDNRKSSLPGLEVRVSRPMFHVENKEYGESLLPPPKSDFAKRLQEFVCENEQKMDEVIDYLSRTFEENELKEEN